MNEVKKAVIPAAGLGTRFLPLTKVWCKELLPLADRPMIEYVVRDAKDSEAEQIIFVLSESKKCILEYFKRKPKLESLLESRNQKEVLEKLLRQESEFEKISFSSVLQQSPKGDGDAILKVKSQVGKDPFGVLFADDVFVTKEPVLAQLKNIFATSQKLVVGLKKIPRERLSSYGVVQVEKIANRLYKIKDIVEKPSIDKAPSDLAICGRYLLTPEIFTYLDKVTPTAKGEVILADALKMMLEDGKIIYGYDIEGEWLECGKTIDWLKSNVQVCMQHPEFGPKMKEWIKAFK